MTSAVDKVKNLVLYFDHDDTCSTFEWDDIIANPAAELPKVISPKKDGETSGNGSSDSDEDSDYEDFLDSDYELDDGDDDLFADYIDENVDDDDVITTEKKSKGKKAMGSRLKGQAVQAKTGDQSSDDEDLELPVDASDGGVRLKFKPWSEDDMINPTFRVGLVFPSVVELRVAINEYAVRNRVQIKMPRNDR